MKSSRPHYLYGHLLTKVRLSSIRGILRIMELRPVAYRTLADRLRTAIRDGEYADGRQLPTEEQLAASFSVSRQTVRRAMQDLVSEGIIYRVAGRGTYPVAEQDRYVNHFGSVEELMALSLDTECEVVSPLQRKVDVETASRLRLPSDEICHVTLVRRHAGTPFCYTSVYLPPRIGQLLTGSAELAEAGRRSRVTVIGLIDAHLAEAVPPGASQRSASQHGTSQHGTSQRSTGQRGAVATAEQSVSAAGAPAFAAPHLGCDVGEPLLRIDRLYFDADDAPVELAISYFDPEHYSYRVRLRRRSR
jgi:DNA-binding GntR family transcriptional regulator